MFEKSLNKTRPINKGVQPHKHFNNHLIMPTNKIFKKKLINAIYYSIEKLTKNNCKAPFRNLFEIY